MKERCAELGISDKVLFLGVRPDVNELMMAMDVFLFPSLFEGLGLVVVEAQATGLTCVVSENVPAPNLTGKVKIMQLADDNMMWVDVLLSADNSRRSDAVNMIIKGHYDIAHEARRLQLFYEKNYT